MHVPGRNRLTAIATPWNGTACRSRSTNSRWPASENLLAVMPLPWYGRSVAPSVISCVQRVGTGQLIGGSLVPEIAGMMGMDGQSGTDRSGRHLLLSRLGELSVIYHDWGPASCGKVSTGRSYPGRINTSSWLR